MEKPQEFYDVHEQSKYKIVLSRPESVEELSDLFITAEELEEMFGHRPYIGSNGQRTFLLTNVISAEVKKLTEELEASGKKTLPIKDEELLEVLQDNYLSDFTEDNRYGRHGNRVCFSKRYKRVKTKATKGDAREFWTRIFPYAFHHKFSCYPSYIPTYDRHLPYFKAWKKILGWERCSKFMDSESKKFYRQIWDNPEEYI